MTSFSVSLFITMAVTPRDSVAPPVDGPLVRPDARNAQIPDSVTLRELFSGRTPLALKAVA
jgi:hypothetical protein